MNTKLSKWLDNFQKEAEADHYEHIHKHLAQLNLPDDPEAFIEGTYRLIVTCLSYAQINNRPFEDFLKHQKYNSISAPACKYIFTFEDIVIIETNTHLSGRLLIDDLSFIDLAYIWEAVLLGDGRIFISRTDGKDLTTDDLTELMSTIENDIHPDDPEDNVEVWFDEFDLDGVLTVYYQESIDNIDAEDDFSEVSNTERNQAATRYRAARADASVGSIRETIENMLNLPKGSVALCGPDSRPLRADALIKTLRKRWDNQLR